MSKIALVQCSSQGNAEANLQQIIPLIEQAARDGAVCVTLPENALMMADSAKARYEYALAEESHTGIAVLRDIAKKLSVAVLIGSVAVRDAYSDKCLNRSILIRDTGEIWARYDKIHLFDATIKDGESHNESNYINHGNEAVLVETPFGKLGLTVCYDVRFAYLFRALAKAGAELITVPAAFVEFTGKAHWHALLRARAIEHGCYIVAPAQTGTHPRNRKTYGHSLVVDPWGEIIADAGEEVGVITVDINLARVAEARQNLQCLRHDREFTLRQIF